MIKPKYKIMFTSDRSLKGTCNQCDMEWCKYTRWCINLEKSLTKDSIYFKKVN